MGLLLEALATAQDLLHEHGEGWWDRAEGQAREELPTVTAEANEALGRAGLSVTEGEASQLLDAAAEGKTHVLKLGSFGFARLVAYLENGDRERARRLYQRAEGGLAECIRDIEDAGDAAQAAEDRRREAWADVEEWLERLGTVGLIVLVSVARRGVGL